MELLLRYAGLFDFDGLYTTIIDWAKRYGYRWHESAYKHKVPSPAGAEQEFNWILEKNVTEYIAYKILFFVKVSELRDVVVQVDGRQQHLSNGRMSVKMISEVDTDWMKPKRKKFAAKFFEFYKGRKAIKYTVEGAHYQKIEGRLLDLHGTIKKFFDMQAKANVAASLLQ